MERMTKIMSDKEFKKKLAEDPYFEDPHTVEKAGFPCAICGKKTVHFENYIYRPHTIMEQKFWRFKCEGIRFGICVHKKCIDKFDEKEFKEKKPGNLMYIPIWLFRSPFISLTEKGKKHVEDLMKKEK